LSYVGKYYRLMRADHIL